MGTTTWTKAQRDVFRVVVADQVTDPNSTDELKLTDTTSVAWDTTTLPTVKANVPVAGITNSMLAQAPALTLKGRPTNVTGPVTDIAAIASSDSIMREKSGQLGFGTIATAGITNNAVDNTKLAQMANSTVKGRVTAGTGNPEDLTQAQLQTLADQWTYAKLASDFTTSSATAVDITGLAFTPAASKNYEFEAILMLRSPTTATVNPEVGLAWPTGMTDGVASIEESQTATGGYLYAVGNINAALLIAAGGLPNTTQSWPCFVRGMLVSGGTPSGTLKLQLASETAATNVTVKAGSFLRWRTF